MRTPLIPSVIVWCIFVSRAAWPPSRPSTTRNCHSGRVRSSGSRTNRLARSRSCRRVPGDGRATRRTWRSMSKSGSSAQIGAPSPVGLGWTRQPRRGTAWTAASIRLRRRSKSGARSSSVTAPNVDARNGSFSTCHISASASLIWRSATETAAGAGSSSAMQPACHVAPLIQPRSTARRRRRAATPRTAPGGEAGDDVGGVVDAHVGA